MNCKAEHGEHFGPERRFLELSFHQGGFLGFESFQLGLNFLLKMFCLCAIFDIEMHCNIIVTQVTENDSAYRNEIIIFSSLICFQVVFKSITITKINERLERFINKFMGFSSMIIWGVEPYGLN